MSTSPSERSRRFSRSDSSRRRSSLITGLALCWLAGTGIVILIKSDRPASVPGPVFEQIRSERVMEMPARAVEIVDRAEPANRTDALREVVRAVSVAARPGILPCTVNTLMQQFPEECEVILATASEARPAEILMFARAAADAAPGRAEDITRILSQNAPEECLPIAMNVWQEVPAGQQDILRGLTNAVPRLTDAVMTVTRILGADDLGLVLQNAHALSNR